MQWGPIAGAGGAGGIPTQSADRYSVDYSEGAVLSSDGTNAFWSQIGTNGWAIARIWTHGYVGGGYKSGAPWRNVNRTVHSTDTSTNLGDTWIDLVLIWQDLSQITDTGSTLWRTPIEFFQLYFWFQYDN